ncbi:hypothetical protein RI129_000069, partial [Pyrocoelia pectoralis]
VAWIHIDRQMILTIHRHVISRTWLLHVSSSVQQEDRGYYMCQVNTNPMISQVGYLQVVVRKSCYSKSSILVTQSTVAVRENQNISLTCKADGFPTPKIMWRREDGQAISVERRKKEYCLNCMVIFSVMPYFESHIITETCVYVCVAVHFSDSRRILTNADKNVFVYIFNLISIDESRWQVYCYVTLYQREYLYLDYTSKYTTYI